MSFVYPLLLGGLLLAGVPILIHLLMQQKPKRLPFPAFRFLLQKHRTNQRTLRLRHLLLLLLRMALLVLLCLALARPRLFSERLNLGSDRPAAVALLFDTSMSMEYTAGGKSRLDEAKRRALELLDDLPESSQVAVLDSAELGGEWQPNLNRAREEISALRLRPGNNPVTRQFAQAGRLFAGVSHDEQSGPPPWFLYLFTDRTLESWDETEVRSTALPEGLNTVLVDVGIDNPADVAIANLELPRTNLGPEDRLEVRVTFQAAGQDCDTFAIFQIDGETPGEKRPVQLRAGESVVVPFERSLTSVTPGPHRLEVKLATNDSLPFDNARFAAFEVRGGRKVLTIADDPNSARIWKLALEADRSFHCDVERTDKAGGLDVKKLLAEYRVVCLVNAAGPDRALWAVLEEYVRKGGGLVLVPGPEIAKAAWHEDAAAQRLLPAQWEQLTTARAEGGTAWEDTSGKHPLLAPFQTWRRTADVDFLKPEFLPRAIRYWSVAPTAAEGTESGRVVVNYAGEGKPAIVERTVGSGRVLQLTTGFDGRRVNDKAWWNNYLESSFYPVFVNLAVGYLAGDAEVRTLNWTAGQVPTVPVPASPRLPIYLLDGPGLVGSDTTVTRAEEQNEVRVPQAVTPGTYLLSGNGQPTAAFSVNVKAEECQLARVPVERIEEVIGPDAVMSVDHQTSFRTALHGRYKQPVELLPWLMLLLLLVLAFENLLANRFYRRSDAAAREPAGGEG